MHGICALHLYIETLHKCYMYTGDSAGSGGAGFCPLVGRSGTGSPLSWAIRRYMASLSVLIVRAERGCSMPYKSLQFSYLQIQVYFSEFASSNNHEYSTDNMFLV